MINNVSELLFKTKLEMSSSWRNPIKLKNL